MGNGTGFQVQEALRGEIRTARLIGLCRGGKYDPQKENCNDTSDAAGQVSDPPIRLFVLSKRSYHTACGRLILED
jgi:hypothetical protein